MLDRRKLILLCLAGAPFAVVPPSTAQEATQEAAAAVGTDAGGGEEVEPEPEPVYPALFGEAEVTATPESVQPLLIAGNETIGALRSEVLRAATASGNQRRQIVVAASDTTRADLQALTSEWIEPSIAEDDPKARTTIAGAVGRMTQAEFELYLGKRLGEENLVDRMVGDAQGALALAALVPSLVPGVGPLPEIDPKADPLVIQAQLTAHKELEKAVSDKRRTVYMRISGNRELGDSTLAELLDAVREYHEGRQAARKSSAEVPPTSVLRAPAPARD